MRGLIEIPADADDELVLQLSKDDENVSRYLQNKEIKRAIYVAGRIVNFVVSD